MSELEPDRSFERELPCFLVYSSRRHVGYISPLLEDRIESVLKERKFSPKRLGDEIRSSEDYLEKLDEVISDCVLGVVILDGFRPNVLFEFGYLLGEGKPVIILQSIDAEINIKSLYHSCEEAGLTEPRFTSLKNPKIDVGFHLSDFAGKHLAFFDRNARRVDSDHPSNVLNGELDRLKEDIIHETQTRVTRGISQTDLVKLVDPIANIVRNYVSGAVLCEVDEINDLYAQVKSVVGDEVPYDVYSMIASTYASKAGRAETVRPETVRCYESAIDLYREIISSLSKDEESIKYADTMDKLGDTYFELSKHKDKRVNCRNAIQSYKEVLDIRTLDTYPEEYSIAQNDLGIAYGTLANSEEKSENSKRAIDAFNEALKIYTFEDLPINYATTQNNLGNAYGTRAEVEDTAENCRKAIDAYKEALKIITKEYPVLYKKIKDNLNSTKTLCKKINDKR